MLFPYEFERFAVDGTEYSHETIMPLLEQVHDNAQGVNFLLAQGVQRIAHDYFGKYGTAGRTAQSAFETGQAICWGDADACGAMLQLLGAPDENNIVTIKRAEDTWHGVSHLMDTRALGLLSLPQTQLLHGRLTANGTFDSALEMAIEATLMETPDADAVNAYYVFGAVSSGGDPNNVTTTPAVTSALSPYLESAPDGWGTHVGDAVAMPYPVGHELIAMLADVLDALVPYANTGVDSSTALALLEGPLKSFSIPGWVDQLQNDQ